MKSTTQLFLVVAALAFTISGASAGSSCSTCSSCCAAKSGRKVILDGKTVIVSDSNYTRGVRSVRMVKVR